MGIGNNYSPYSASSPRLESATEKFMDGVKETQALKQEERVALVETGQEMQIANVLQRPPKGPISTIFKKLKEFVRRVTRKDGADIKGRQVAKSSQIVKDKAGEFAKKNPELSKETLENILKELVRRHGESEDGLSAQDVEDLVLAYYPDPYLANDVLNFLIESTEGGLNDTVRDAQGNHEELYPREIQIGKNISEEARTFESRGLDSPSKLREWYRSAVTSTAGQVKTTDLFLKMMDRFGFEKLVKANHFYLAALGADLRKGGLSVPELADKVHQVRSLQAIVNVFRMSRMRMRVIDKALNYYAKLGVREQLPPGFDFQSLGRLTMNILQDRNISKDTILQKVRAQGFGNSEVAMMCVIQQMSLMLNDLDSHRVFMSPVHKEQTEKAFKETCEFLYANAQPEETPEWFDEELLPDGIDKDLAQDVNLFEGELASFRQMTPEDKQALSEFEACFNRSMDLGGFDEPTKTDDTLDLSDVDVGFDLGSENIKDNPKLGG